MDEPQKTPGADGEQGVETINAAVRQHETGLKPGDWTLRVSGKEKVDLKILSETLYKFFDLFNAEFFGTRLPPPIITFKPTGRRTLGHFCPGRNDIGAKLELNINTMHLNRPLLLLLEIELHEMIHLSQYAFPDIYGRDNYCSSYHNMRFREKAAALGIPCSQWGAAMNIVDDPFRAFCLRHGIEAIQYRLAVDSSETGFGGRCRRKLQKWVCSCTPVYGVWVAVRSFSARCNTCKADFHLADGEPGLV